MDERPDGRLYSRVTRRAQAILKSLDSGTPANLNEAVERAAANEEFFLKRYGRSMSLPRVRDYFSYLEHIQTVSLAGGNVVRKFPQYVEDSQWAQALSDRARTALAKDINIKFGEIPKELGRLAAKIRAKGVPPTVPRLVQDLSDGRVRSAEFMRWDIYIWCDGPSATLQISRIPALWGVG